MKSWLQKLPTMVWAVGLAGALYAHTEPSEMPDVWRWSWMRAAGLGCLGLLLGYALVALRYPRWLRLNNYLSYLALVCLVSLEIIFRLWPAMIPGEELILHASKSIRKQYAISRGYMTEEVLSSEPSNELIYHFLPSSQLKAYPHVRIDSDGYRNVSMAEPKKVDVVLLGDSLTLALDAEEDMGTILGQRGLAARNLGMFGYAPQQYRDVYKHFIVDQQVAHRYVLIFLFAGNDVDDAQNYEHVRASGGDFKEYLPQMKSIGWLEESMPVMVSVMRGVPRFLKSRFVTNRGRTVALPYRTVHTGEVMPPPLVRVESDEWNTFFRPVTDIIAMARSQGAVPMVYLYPSAATVYSPFDPSLRQYDRHYQSLADGLQRMLGLQGVLFYDLQELLRAEMRDQFIFAHDQDYHLNTIGVQKVAQEVLRSLGQTRGL